MMNDKKNDIVLFLGIKLYFCSKLCEMKKVIKKIAVVINPIAGVGSKEKIPKMLEALCNERDITIQIFHTGYAGHASELTRQAIQDHADCVIAVGGDGTVNEVARMLLHSDVVLGIIPIGSGNGLARELNIPMDVRSAMDVIFSNHISTIDACKANEHFFFCTCGVGFDAVVSAEFAKEKRRGQLTYLKEIVENYIDYKPGKYELHINDYIIQEEAFLITCANASQYGNNAYIAPKADICDGQMDITILSTFNTLDIGPLAIQLFTKTIDKNSKIKIFRTEKARIVRQHAGIMHIDGDPVMAAKDIELSVISSALHVFTAEYVSFSEIVQRRLQKKSTSGQSSIR